MRHLRVIGGLEVSADSESSQILHALRIGAWGVQNRPKGQTDERQAIPT